MVTDVTVTKEPMCKLCISYIKDNEWTYLDDDILKRLEFLQLILDRNCVKSNFLCIKCNNKVADVFDFKSCVVISTESYSNLIEDIPSMGTGAIAMSICYLCKKNEDQQFMISLNKLLKDDGMMQLFEEHLKEVELENVENSTVCENCQKSLTSFWNLSELCFKAREWSDGDITDNKNDFEMVEGNKEKNYNDDDDLSNSNTNWSCAFEVIDNNQSKKRQFASGCSSSDFSIKEEEVDEILEYSEDLCLFSGNIKKEESVINEAAEMSELQLKTEEIEIKDENGLLEEYANHQNVREENTHEDKNKAKLCYHYSYQTYENGDLNQHLKVHKNSKKVQIYKCKECFFESKYKERVKIHSLTHQSFDEVNIYKCNKCSFETKYNYVLMSHALIHYNSSKMLMYKCEKCAFETKLKDTLRKHLLRHKSLDEVQMYKCKDCSYVSRNKGDLNRHLVKHKSLDEVDVYKCKKCPHVTKYKSGLRKHALLHLNEIQIYKCEDCSFETKFKQRLHFHLRKHK